MNSRLITTLTAVVTVGVATIAGTALAQPDVEPGAPTLAAQQWEAADAPADTYITGQLVEAGTPGLFVPITPYRAFDSRNAQGPLISLDAPDGNAVALNILANQDGVLAIPDSATAISYNVTIVNQTSSGFLTVASVSQAPRDAIASSTVNWASPGGAIANGSTVAVGMFEDKPGYIGVIVGGPVDATTDFIIDVTGYYIAA